MKNLLMIALLMSPTVGSASTLLNCSQTMNKFFNLALADAPYEIYENFFDMGGSVFFAGNTEQEKRMAFQVVLQEVYETKGYNVKIKQDHRVQTPDGKCLGNLDALFTDY